MNAVCEWDVAIWVKELRRACVMIIEGDRAALRMNKGVLRSWRSSEAIEESCGGVEGFGEDQGSSQDIKERCGNSFCKDQ